MAKKHENEKEVVLDFAKDIEIGIAEQKTEDELTRALEAQQEYKNSMLRLKADFDNYKKRNAELSVKMREAGAADAIEALFPVLDSLERAVTMSEGKEQEGIKLVLKQFHDCMEKLGVSEINPLGEDFNPDYHNAVMSCDDPEQKGKVVEVLQKGYQFKNKILRYAMVKIAN